MEITTTAGALLAGLVTSVHCAGMCGPIACGIGTLARSEKERLIAATVYHGARLFSYSLIGAVCGMIGKQPLQWFFDSPAVLLPWALVVGLISPVNSHCLSWLRGPLHPAGRWGRKFVFGLAICPRFGPQPRPPLRGDRTYFHIHPRRENKTLQ